MRTNRLAVFVFLILIVIFLFEFGFGDGSPKNKIEAALDIFAKIAAVGGLLGLLYQFKRDKDISEANFVLGLNESFIINEKMSRIYAILETSKENKQRDNPFTDADLIDMANYLSFFETFSGLIERGVVDIKLIDILAYRFFLGTNNRFMQEKLLCRPGKEIAWRDIYSLHDTWRSYRLQKQMPVWQEEFDLSKTSAYSNIIDRSS